VSLAKVRGNFASGHALPCHHERRTLSGWQLRERLADRAPALAIEDDSIRHEGLIAVHETRGQATCDRRATDPADREVHGRPVHPGAGGVWIAVCLGFSEQP